MIQGITAVNSSLTFYGVSKSKGEFGMIRPVMTGFISLSLLVAATAQDSQKTQKKVTQQPDQTDRANKLGQQGDADQDSKAGQPVAEQTQRTELPECLNQIDLSEQQKQEILTIYRESDLKSQQLWDHVQDLHRQAISMEAAVIAAARLEGHDHGTHHDQAGQPANNDRKPEADLPETGKGESPVDEADDKAEKTAATSSPKENAEKRRAAKIQERDDANARKTNRRDERSAQESAHVGKDESTGWQGLDGDLNIVAIRVGVAQPDGRIREYLLTQPNQKEDPGSNQTFHTHQGQLTQVWKDIHEGHEQLVELEASTIVKVEAQLTEVQLKKLDATQSQASNTPKSQNDDSRR